MACCVSDVCYWGMFRWMWLWMEEVTGKNKVLMSIELSEVSAWETVPQGSRTWDRVVLSEVNWCNDTGPGLKIGQGHCLDKRQKTLVFSQNLLCLALSGSAFVCQVIMFHSPRRRFKAWLVFDWIPYSWDWFPRLNLGKRVSPLPSEVFGHWNSPAVLCI